MRINYDYSRRLLGVLLVQPAGEWEQPFRNPFGISLNTLQKRIQNELECVLATCSQVDEFDVIALQVDFPSSCCHLVVRQGKLGGFLNPKLFNRAPYPGKPNIVYFSEAFQDVHLDKVLEGQKRGPSAKDRRKRSGACFTDRPVPYSAHRNKKIPSRLFEGVIGNLKRIESCALH